MKTFILAVSLSSSLFFPNTPEFTRLQELYWDCDTMFMRNELHPQDMICCLAITDDFKLFFESHDDFMEYWNNYKHLEWNKRGFKQGTIDAMVS